MRTSCSQQLSFRQHRVKPLLAGDATAMRSAKPRETTRTEGFAWSCFVCVRGSLSASIVGHQQSCSLKPFSVSLLGHIDIAPLRSFDKLDRVAPDRLHYRNRLPLGNASRSNDVFFWRRCRCRGFFSFFGFFGFPRTVGCTRIARQERGLTGSRSLGILLIAIIAHHQLQLPFVDCQRQFSACSGVT